jgi:hypothetical protein
MLRSLKITNMATVRDFEIITDKFHLSLKWYASLKSGKKWTQVDN